MSAKRTIQALKPQLRWAVSRDVRSPPQPTEGQRLAGRVAKRDAHLAAEREARAEAERKRRKAEFQRDALQLRDAVRRRAKGFGADENDPRTRMYQSKLHRAFAAHYRSGSSKPFSPLAFMRQLDHECGFAALPPTPANANPLAAQLPAPDTQAEARRNNVRPAPGQPQSRDTDHEYREAQQRSEQDRQQMRMNDQQKRDFYARHKGLQDPKLLAPCG